MGLNKETRSVVPPALLKLNDAMNGAHALMIDHLFGGATDFFSSWSGSPYATDARRIYELCSAAERGAGKGYALIDQVAGMLGIGGWFSWKADPGEFAIMDQSTTDAVEGVKNPELLRAKAPEAVPLLLQALRRFDGMENRAIAELTQEVALLGENGLNYTDSDKVYTLKSAPGETFTGLGLMCLMYAGIHRLAPAGADPGMNLHDEFAMALSLYHSEKDR